ncbi:hypothetical protein BRADI_4g15632v3, partial [Brachypodium distachyon]
SPAQPPQVLVFLLLHEHEQTQAQRRRRRNLLRLPSPALTVPRPGALNRIPRASSPQSPPQFPKLQPNGLPTVLLSING